MRCGAGVSPVFLQCVEMRKIAGGTPAPRKPARLIELLAYVSLVRAIAKKKSCCIGHQIWHRMAEGLAIASPSLQSNARANSGMLDGAAMARKRANG